MIAYWIINLENKLINKDKKRKNIINGGILVGVVFYWTFILFYYRSVLYDINNLWKWNKIREDKIQDRIPKDKDIKTRKVINNLLNRLNLTYTKMRHKIFTTESR